MHHTIKAIYRGSGHQDSRPLRDSSPIASGASHCSRGYRTFHTMTIANSHCAVSMLPSGSSGVKMLRTPVTARRRRRAMGSDVRYSSRYLLSSLRTVVGIALICSWARSSRADTISVVTPVSTAAGEHLVVEWTYASDDQSSGTTGDINPFEIELRSCGTGGSGCEDGSCGSTSLGTLCPLEGGCMDADGKYNVIIPSDAEPGDYVIYLSYMGPSTSANSGEVSACTESFGVTSPDVPLGTPAIAATAPQVGLSPGQAFTARWTYDDGQGGKDGNFDVDLYSCADGACDGER